MPARTRQHAEPSLIGCAIALGGATLGVVGLWLPFWDPESVIRAYPYGATVADKDRLLLESAPGLLFIGVAVWCAASVVIAYLGRRQTRGPMTAGVVAIFVGILTGLFAVISTPAPFSVQSGSAGPGSGVYVELIAGLLMVTGGLLILRSSVVHTLVVTSAALVLVTASGWGLSGLSEPVPAYADFPVAGAPGMTVTEYANSIASSCRFLGVEVIAERFGATPTAEDAARAVAGELELDRPWSDAAYEGCLRGLGGGP